MLIVGVFELVLAAGFVVLGVAVPAAESGMYLTAAILGVTGIVLLLVGRGAGARAANVRRLEATGLPGRAIVVGLTQTGTFLNNNPQVAMDLQVTVAGRPPYVVRHKEFVPMILLGRLNSGQPLAVKVDPANPNNVVVLWNAPPAVAGPWTGGAVGVSEGGTETLGEIQQALQGSGIATASAFHSAEQGGYSIHQLREYLKANGLSGWATVDVLEDTGRTVGDDHMFVMQATVHLGGRAPYQTSKSAAMVPLSAVSKVYVGASIPVKVAPDNQDLVMFEWDRL